MRITMKTSTHATSNYPSRNIEYLVYHYTAGVSSKKGSALNTAEWFANPKAGGSADFIVDDEFIVQYNPDPKNKYCWSVGGSKYNSMTTNLGGKFYGKCTNKNSISIEICSNKKNTKSLSANDSDWYFIEETLSNAIELGRHLMESYNIPIDRVIMHHQVTGKICPNPWVLNDSRLNEWYKFKDRLLNNLSNTENNIKSRRVKVTADKLFIRKGPGTNYDKSGSITDKGVYTIIDTSPGKGSNNGWGKLKSGAGWISLDYVENL